MRESLSRRDANYERSNQERMRRLGKVCHEDVLKPYAVFRRGCAGSGSDYGWNGESATPAIIHACGYAAEYGGNFISSLRRLRQACKGQGWDFVVLFPEAARERSWCRRLAAENWRIHFIPDDASIVRCVWVLSKILFEENAQLIHTHFTQYDVIAWFASMIAAGIRARPIQLVWHVHSDVQVENTFLRKAKDSIKYRFMGQWAHIFLVSDHLKNRPLRAGFRPEKMWVVPNGIDLSRLDGARDLTDATEGMGVRRVTSVLMFGWSPVIKGVDVALAAFEIVARSRGDVTLQLVGIENTCEAVGRKYPGGNPPWLHLLPPIETVAEYFSGADIFLSASRREGFPYSVFEAGASGCLLVLSDIPAMQWMKHSVHCWWFRSGDPVELAEQIIDCAGMSVVERQEVVRMNASFIRERLPMEKWAFEVMGIYGRICGMNPLS